MKETKIKLQGNAITLAGQVRIKVTDDTLGRSLGYGQSHTLL